MKKQICAKKFKLRTNTYSQTDLNEIMAKQLDVLKAIASRKGWEGPDYFYPAIHEGDEKFDTVQHPSMAMNQEYKQRWIKEYVLCLHSEASELLDLINWKHWKETQNPVDWEEAKFEIVDLLIFVLNLSLASGMGPGELAQRVSHKMDINIVRQQNKY